MACSDNLAICPSALPRWKARPLHRCAHHRSTVCPAMAASPPSQRRRRSRRPWAPPRVVPSTSARPSCRHSRPRCPTPSHPSRSPWLASQSPRYPSLTRHRLFHPSLLSWQVHHTPSSPSTTPPPSTRSHHPPCLSTHPPPLPSQTRPAMQCRASTRYLFPPMTARRTPWVG